MKTNVFWTAASPSSRLSLLGFPLLLIAAQTRISSSARERRVETRRDGLMKRREGECFWEEGGVEVDVGLRGFCWSVKLLSSCCLKILLTSKAPTGHSITSDRTCSVTAGDGESSEQEAGHFLVL